MAADCSSGIVIVTFTDAIPITILQRCRSTKGRIHGNMIELGLSHHSFCAITNCWSLRER